MNIEKKSIKSILLSVFSVLLFSFTSSINLQAQDENQTTRAHLNEAEIALSEFNYKKLIEAYVRASESSNDVMLTKQAAWLANNYHFDDIALSLAKRWLYLDSDSDSALLFLINRQIDANLIIAAKNNLKKLLAKNEGNADEVFLAVIPYLTTADYNKLNNLIYYFTKIYNKSEYVQYAYASSLMQNGNYDAALRYAEKAITLDEKWEKPKLLITRILLLSDKNEQAINYIAEYIGNQINPSSAARIELALAYMSSDRLDDALGQVSQILLEKNNQPEAVRLMAIINFRLGDYDAAWLDFSELLESDLYPMDAKFYMGRISEIKGNKVKALEFYRGVQSGINVVYSQIKVSNMMISLNSGEAGINHLRNFGQQYPKYMRDMLIAEASLLVSLDQKIEAREAYKNLISYYPNDYSFGLRFAELLLDADHISEALHQYSLLEKRHPKNPDILNAYGYVLTNYSDDYKKALTLIKKALRYDDKNPAIIDSYGWILYRTGEYSKALIELKKAFSLYEDPEIMSHIIEVLVTTNKTSEASALMDEAKNKYPDNLYINELYNRYPLIWE